MCKRSQRALSGCSHRGAGRREDSVPDLPQRSSHVPDGDFHGEDLSEGLKTTGHVPDVPYGAGHPALGSPKRRVEDSHRRTGGSTASRSWTLSGAKSSMPEASSGRRRCASWCQHDRPWHPPSHRRRLGAGGEGRGRARGPVRVCAPGRGGADERPARGPAADGLPTGPPRADAERS